MLILARYLEEAILIGETRITVLGIRRHKRGRLSVKLGIEAPRHIPVIRAELTLKQCTPSMEAPVTQHVYPAHNTSISSTTSQKGENV